MAIQIDEIDLKQIGTPKEARVTLAQVQVPDPSKIRPDGYLNSVEKAEKNKLIEIQSERIRKELKRALLDEPNFILFPELSIPWEMQNELSKLAIKENVYIIGGLTYGPDYQNTCAIFLPFKSEKISLQYKLNRAPAEEKDVKTGQRILIFKNSGFGTFASVICYDFTSLHIAREIQKHNVNILFLPTHNQAVSLFDDMAIGQCYALYTYLCLSNSAGSGLGNSASYGPVRATEGGRLQQERLIGKIAGTQETTLTTVLDIPGLLESIKRFKNNSAVLSGFITPPADLREPGVLISPYTPLGPARENFVGREKQIREFWACIESNNHVLLLGPSGTGKTSLIHRLRAEALIEFRTGFIEVYDTEDTFDFFRRLSVEITSRAETEKRSVQFKDTLQAVLDDIKKTRDAVAQYGFEESSKAFVEAFHNLALAIDAQKIGKIVIFIDQAERLAWLEEDPDKQYYAIRILIKIMRDLEVLGAPVLFVLAIRQHDYDPLIAIASDHIPARIVAIQKFTEEDAILSVEKPLPPEISIDRAVSLKIAELSNGIPFFVQLLADAAFKKLGQQKVIDIKVFNELNIKDQRDIFPILMNTLTPNEQQFVEAIGISHEYTVRMEDIIKELNIETDEFRHVADLLLGKNIIESLENDRFRFVHDQMKGFIQREWLAAKMSSREKLRTETETALQMLFLSPEDEITVSFGLPPVAMCCYKSLILYDIDNLSRILEQVATLKHNNIASLCVAVLTVCFKCTSRNVFNNLRSRLAQLLEKNDFFFKASLMFAIEMNNNETPNLETAQRAIDLAEKSVDVIKDSEEIRHAISYYLLATKWAISIGYFSRKEHLFKRFNEVLNEILQSGTENDMGWPAIVGGRMDSYYLESYIGYLGRIAGLADEMESFREQNEFLKMALKLSIEYMNKKNKEDEFLSVDEYAQIADLAEKVGDDKLRYEIYRKAIDVVSRDAEEKEKEDYLDASRLYAKVAEFAEKIGNDKLRRELYNKAIHLRLRIEEKGNKYGRASGHYAEAAEFAEKIGNDKLRRELYSKAIDVGSKDAEEKEKEDYLDASRLYAKVAEFAEKIGNDKLRRELYSKAIDVGSKDAEEKEKEDYSDASRLYVEVAEFAEKIGNDKLRRELYNKAIELRLKNATSEEKIGKLSSASSDYVQTAKWACAIGDDVNVDILYIKAAQSLLKSAETYEKLASFLLSRGTLEAANALRDYFSKDAEEFAYFNKISSIVENCRLFIESISGPRFFD